MEEGGVGVEEEWWGEGEGGCVPVLVGGEDRGLGGAVDYDDVGGRGGEGGEGEGGEEQEGVEERERHW